MQVVRSRNRLENAVSFGPQEWLIVGVIVVVLFFGAPRLPQLGRSLGESIRGFKKGLREDAGDADAKSGDDEAARTGDSAAAKKGGDEPKG